MKYVENSEENMHVDNEAFKSHHAFAFIPRTRVEAAEPEFVEVKHFKRKR